MVCASQLLLLDDVQRTWTEQVIINGSNKHFILMKKSVTGRPH